MNWWDWMSRRMAGFQARLSGELFKPSGRGLVGGRRLEDWENSWRRIGLLPSAHLTAPRETMGLFRLRLGGDIVYLGRSQGASLRRSLKGLHGGADPGTILGQHLRQRSHELVVEILITGCTEVADSLEQRWLQQLRPPWNRLETQKPSVLAANPAATALGERSPG